MGAVRALTADEISMSKAIFGENIDYSRVRVHHESYFPFGAQDNDVAMAPNGNIYFDPDGTLYRADFSKADISSQALFIHEMTHVWQHQKGVNVRLRGIYQRNYTYLPFDASKSFGDYGIEQQGDIVRDYFLLTKGRSLGSQYPVRAVYERLIPFVSQGLSQGNK